VLVRVIVFVIVIVIDFVREKRGEIEIRSVAKSKHGVIAVP